MARTRFINGITELTFIIIISINISYADWNNIKSALHRLENDLEISFTQIENEIEIRHCENSPIAFAKNARLTLRIF